MNVDPETNELLLTRIRSPQDQAAWSEFVSIYQPLILRMGRKMKLQHADSCNLVQDVFHKVGGAIQTWKSEQPEGSFRRWLNTIARNAAIDLLRRVRPDVSRGGTSALDLLSSLPAPTAPESSSEHFEQELERETFCWAATQIEREFASETWLAFWKTVVEGEDCDHVAAELNKSVGAVYTARSRVIRRLKQVIEESGWSSSSNASEYADVTHENR